MSRIAVGTQQAMPATKRPIAIIGAGGIVRSAHLPAYRKAGFDVMGILDVLPDKAAALAAEFGIPQVFPTLEEMVRRAPGSTVFDVAVPAGELTRILPSLPSGAGVLMQKPMGEDLEQARAILRICKERSLTAAVNFQLRYSPPIVAVRNLIESGALGELHDIDVRVTVFTPWSSWSFLQSCARVEILYHSIHYIDLIRSFFGNPRGMYAKTVKHPKTMMLSSTRSAILMDYGDVRRATITTNHDHEAGPKHQESYIKFEGTRGSVKLTLGLLLDYPRGVQDRFELCTHDGGGEPVWREIPIEGTWFPDAFIGTMASVMRALEDPARPIPTRVEDAFITMACVEAAHASSAAGATPIETAP